MIIMLCSIEGATNVTNMGGSSFWIKEVKVLKYIFTKDDIEKLRSTKKVNVELSEVLENEVLILLESDGLQKLPIQQSCILLETGDKVLEILENNLLIEYIERSTVKSVEYYRIAKRNEHEFQMIYSLVGIHDDITEQWLLEQSE